ncbi:MAG: hypothetical protein MJZ26_09075 [Fibrobacter sp.]|nr:hypothetical protein [Fibrobacter sp.]
MNKEIAIELLKEFQDSMNLNIHMKSGSVIRISGGIEAIFNNTDDLLTILTEDDGTYVVPASSIEFIHV